MCGGGGRLILKQNYYHVMLLDKKQSWKAKVGKHAQNLFNILENNLLCVIAGNTVGEITGG